MVGNEQEISLGENLGGYYGDFEYKIRVLYLWPIKGAGEGGPIVSIDQDIKS